MSKIDRLGVFDKDTGEKFDNGIEVFKSVIREEFKNKIIELQFKYNKTPEKINSEEIEELIKYNKTILNKSKLKEYESFDTYYTANKEKLNSCLDTLSDTAYKCFSKLVVRYTSSANTIQYKNNINIIKDKDIAKVLEITPRRWVDIKKELVAINAIKKIKLNNIAFYKINPTVIGHSMKITKCTYYAFRKELIKEFEPIKALYWDKLLIEEFGNDILKED